VLRATGSPTGRNGRGADRADGERPPGPIPVRSATHLPAPDVPAHAPRVTLPMGRTPRSPPGVPTGGFWLRRRRHRHPGRSSGLLLRIGPSQPPGNSRLRASPPCDRSASVSARPGPCPRRRTGSPPLSGGGWQNRYHGQDVVTDPTPTGASQPGIPLAATVGTSVPVRPPRGPCVRERGGDRRNHHDQIPGRSRRPVRLDALGLGPTPRRYTHGTTAGPRYPRPRARGLRDGYPRDDPVRVPGNCRQAAPGVGVKTLGPSGGQRVVDVSGTTTNQDFARLA